MDASRCSGTLLSTGFSANSCNHSGRSSNGLQRTFSSSSFLFLFPISAGSCDGLSHTVLLVLSVLVGAGCNVETTASCNTDVGDVGTPELAEFVDKPGTTIGTQFAVLHFFRLPLFDELWFCGQWFTRKNIRDLGRIFQVREQLVYFREVSLSQIYIQFFDIHGGIFYCAHFAVGYNNRPQTFSVFYGFQFGGVNGLS